MFTILKYTAWVLAFFGFGISSASAMVWVEITGKSGIVVNSLDEQLATVEQGAYQVPVSQTTIKGTLAVDGQEFHGQNTLNVDLISDSAGQYNSVLSVKDTATGEVTEIQSAPSGIFQGSVCTPPQKPPEDGL
ncbi:MAG: hypothetical protein ACYSUX_15875 [Planctomycetota bacterium]|jgi:hypothetical protein